jgi:hypothetical protein
MNPAPPVISARRFEGDAATPKPYRRRRRWSSERLPKLISDPVFAGIPVVRDSGDPQVAARTIARLVPTEEVAEAVRLQLGSDLSRSALLAAVSAHAHDEWPRPWLLVPVALAVGAAIGLALLVVARRRRPSRTERELVRRAGDIAAPGGWKIDDLERLVAAHRSDEPERAHEWEAYVFHLRQYADAEGQLPPEFDALVEEAFRDLVASDASLKPSAVEADQVP